MKNRIKYVTRRGGTKTIPAPKKTAADDRKAKKPLKPEVKENE